MHTKKLSVSPVLRVHLLFNDISVANSDKQLEFHRLQPSATCIPAERCRRQFHISATAVGALGLVYFALVLGDELWRSLVVLCILQMPVCFSVAISSTRMWIYT